jgi:hypothetical protein
MPVSYLSRRDNRTQPGVLTPGTRKKRPALPVRRSSGNVGRRRKGAEDIVPLAHLSMQALGTTLYRPFSTSNPAAAGCNSDFAHYSHNPILHHSACPDSRTRTSTKRLVRATSFWGAKPGLKPRAESCRPFGTNCENPNCMLRPVHQIPTHSEGPNVVQIQIIDSPWRDLWSL